jgi:hypothetical protein
MRPRVRTQDDACLRTDLGAVRPRPVFIIGLHRSGTTFLYRTLAGALPVASLTAYHVIHYDSILTQHHDGTAEAARRRLDGLFRSWGMATRRIDDVPLSHALLEEYGWVLRRRTGSFHASRRTAPLIDEINRTLQFLEPRSEAVVQKNPWDTGHVRSLLACFPEARFVFIERDPMAIVNSQFRIAKYSREERDPYLNLLLEGIPFGRAWMSLQRGARRAAGERLFVRIALRYITANVELELARLETSWAAVPPRLRLAVDYAGLVGDPEETLSRTQAFLALTLRSDAVRIRPEPRDATLLPEVAAIEARFRGRLKNKGIAQRPLG